MGDGTWKEGIREKTITCPKCGEEMFEVPQENMTEGQEADYMMGFNTPFECQNCGYCNLFDLGYRGDIFGWDDPDIDELVEITRIDPSSFEEVIENALRSKCFVEVISLVHNVIEAYLKTKIKDYLSADKTRLQLIKEKFKPQYLKDYNTICYILGLIKPENYNALKKFNKKRNRVIHELLKKVMTIEEMKKIAREGRELQMKLSPLNHSPEDIVNIMNHFDEITK